MDSKERILKAGAQIVQDKGFSGAGLAEILNAADVPKGSFYYYFKSKEDFGLCLIDYFAARLKEMRAAFAKDVESSSIGRIRSIMKRQAESFQKNDFKGGCPIGNLAQEMGDQNPKFREKLDAAFSDMKNEMALLLEQARENGEIPASIDAGETADFIITYWEGALMRMKASKNLSAYKVFDRIVFNRMLKQDD